MSKNVVSLRGWNALAAPADIHCVPRFKIVRYKERLVCLYVYLRCDSVLHYRWGRSSDWLLVTRTGPQRDLSQAQRSSEAALLQRAELTEAGAVAAARRSHRSKLQAHRDGSGRAVATTKVAVAAA